MDSECDSNPIANPDRYPLARSVQWVSLFSPHVLLYRKLELGR